MRAKPLLTYGLVASALALPASAWALGLGRLTVDSALGQPLSARIELTSATRDELDTLNAKVADPSLYRQNNLTYQGVLARTRVAVETSGGTSFLRVTSPIPVNEPFLDLMVELNWSSGRVVREYTFLLDPPGVAAPAVAEPVTPPRTGVAARPAAAASAAAPGAAAPSSGAIRSPAAAASGAGSQYTVKRGDTLAGIAGQYKPESATLEQMLAALFKGNPNAFDDNNMNRLRRGAIMNLPAPSEVAASDPAEATRVVRMQASDWRNYRNRVAGTVPAAEGAGSRATAGRIGASVTESTPAAAPGGDQLKVQSTPRTRANEDLAAAQKDAKDKGDRIAALEKMVRDLQDRLNKGGVPGGVAAPDAGKSKGPELAVAPPVALPAPTANAPATTTPAAPATPPAAEPSKSATPPKADTAAPAPAPAAPKVEPVPAAKAPPKAPAGFFEDLFSNTPLWAIGAGAVAVLAGLAALIAARRRKATKFEDSIISGTDIKTNTVFGSTGGGVVNTGENSLASDFSREGLGNIDTDEVDPIAEAEVYLAYGRDAQAEEILKDALKKDPQRQEIYLKLLEIHAQHNKPSAFETVATELFAVSQGQGEVWPKAVALGRQLDPNNPMFAEGGAPPIPGMAAARAAEAAGGAALRKNEPPLDRMIDDDITIAPGMKPHAQDSVFGGAPKAAEQSVHDKIEASAASFKSTMADVAGAGTVAVAGAMAAGKSEIDTLAGNLGDKVDTAPQSAKYDLDFHLDEADKVPPLKPVGDAAPDTGPTPSQLMRPAAALELDKLDLSFDPDKATFEDPTPSVLDGQWHDAATKLDLAKAYQEMGDVEGAREILQEVLHEGDDQQKTEAQTLLAKLG